jgi:hypothetical protein
MYVTSVTGNYVSSSVLMLCFIQSLQESAELVVLWHKSQLIPSSSLNTVCDQSVVSFDSHQMTYNSSFIYSTKFADYFVVYCGIAMIPGAWGK